MDCAKVWAPQGREDIVAPLISKDTRQVFKLFTTVFYSGLV